MSLLLAQYAALTEEHSALYGERTVVLMQVGAFYEVYGQQLVAEKTYSSTFSKIAEFARICELNIGEKKNFQNSMPEGSLAVLCGFKDLMLDKYLRKLQDAGYTVVLVEEDIDGRKDEHGNVLRTVTQIVSPGTYLEQPSATAEPSCASAVSNNIATLWLEIIPANTRRKQPTLLVPGIATVDILTGRSFLFQYQVPYQPEDPACLDELERFFSIHPPTELIVISHALGKEEMEDILKYANAYESVRKLLLLPSGETAAPMRKAIANCEKQSYQTEVLKQFFPQYGGAAFHQPFYDNVVSAQSFCFLLDYLFQHNPHLVRQVANPVFENCTDRLVLANHSLKQLNILHDHVHTGKHSSVLRLLNDCYTPMGRRRFQQILLNPTTLRDRLQRDYDITEHLLTPSVWGGLVKSWKEQLPGVLDLSLWMRNAYNHKVAPSACCRAYHTLGVARALAKQLQGGGGDDNAVCTYLESAHSLRIDTLLSNIAQARDYLHSYLVVDLAQHIDACTRFETNFFQKGISAELDAVLSQLETAQQMIASFQYMLNILLERKEKKKAKDDVLIKLVETEKGCSLQLTQRRSELLMSVFPKDADDDMMYRFDDRNEVWKLGRRDFTFHKVGAKEVSVSHPLLDEHCQTVVQCKSILRDVLARTYQTFLSVLPSVHEKLESVVEFLTAIDVLQVRATLAKQYHYCKPVFLADLSSSGEQPGKSFVQATGLRHCLIERLQTSESYVTNDVTLGDGVTDGILLYGTNAVGKTSIIRALGIAVIMAQAGLFVPATTFVYRPYQYLFTRILANDNLFRGLSSFGVEMSELKTILTLANENSLILGDELCSTTETCSAISIFVTGIQQLHQKHSSFIFATHLHEIVAYDEVLAMNRLQMMHLRVTYDMQRNQLVYDRKLQPGPGHNMYGLEVCKAMHLPEAFLEQALALRTKHFPETGSLLQLRSSRYNARKVVNRCEQCGLRPAQEVHHVLPQKDADAEGFVQSGSTVVHKNHLSNLRALCEACHAAEHNKPRRT